MAPLLTAGRHLLLRVGSMLAVTTGATAIAARVDEPTLAAHQIAASMFLFLALVLDALAIPAQTLVADELGQGSVAGAGGAVPPLRPPVDHRRRGDRRRARRARARAARRLQRRPGGRRPGDARRLWWLAAMLVPAAIAFAYDGVLIGAADYRFLGYAALAYLVSMVPVGAVLVATDAGIGAIWAAFGLWMVLRAVCNHLRAVPRAAATVAVPVARREPRLLVTGGTGYLGARRRRGRRRRRMGRHAPSVRRDLDVRDAAAVAAFVDRLRPDAIVHTAYVRDGPTARAVNVDGSAAVAAAAGSARLVHVSTDVVFDGRLGRPYREDDAASPITDYGRTKADAERAVLRTRARRGRRADVADLRRSRSPAEPARAGGARPRRRRSTPTSCAARSRSTTSPRRSSSCAASTSPASSTSPAPMALSRHQFAEADRRPPRARRRRPARPPARLPRSTARSPERVLRDPPARASARCWSGGHTSSAARRSAAAGPRPSMRATVTGSEPAAAASRAPSASWSW